LHRVTATPLDRFQKGESMAIWDLFSKREARRNKQGQEDVYQYDDLPKAFRVQVVHIWDDVLGRWVQPSIYASARDITPNVYWIEIFKVLTREKGVFALHNSGDNPCEQCHRYMLDAEAKDAMDLIELSLRFIDGPLRDLNPHERQRWGLKSPDRAIEELNGRFRENGIGYEFAGGEIVRVDSKYIHAEAVRPALSLLHGAGKGFAGPLQEFLQAHEYHREGEDKDAITWALKAFESTMKAICTARHWGFDPHKDTAAKLLEIVFNNNLVPTYLQNQFSALRSVLESGVPTVRNKTSGHGQGPAPTIVPGHFTRFALHLAATNIVFLIECHKAMP
jgi:hypothetical protein